MNYRINVPRLDASSADFESALQQRLGREMLVDEKVGATVAAILADVRQRGDEAVLEYTRKFDGFQAESMADLTLDQEQLRQALGAISSSQREALSHAADRIRSYHEHQRQKSWQYTEEDGSRYGQHITALERAGIYVPGGKANYPSSMLMLAVPASVAGVKEIIATVPTAIGEEGNLIYAAAALAGVSRVYTIGGAQAIAAMAYGTDAVPKVDKIAGPGNIFVTVAKKQVFGEVGIDMIAGPSELTIICDGGTDPDWIAMDLFSQAEHDEQAQSILISPEPAYLDAVQASVEKLLPTLERRDIVATSMAERGLFIQTSSLAEAARVSNLIAPEHLELSVESPEQLLSLIDQAGAIFLGRHTAEALGDYCAGPSHVLPTSGTARFFSALGVYDFQKRSSIIHCSPVGASNLGSTASELARNEHLEAHARSAEYRINKDD